jgi:hypothetical protein
MPLKVEIVADISSSRNSTKANVVAIPVLEVVARNWTWSTGGPPAAE